MKALLFLIVVGAAGLGAGVLVFSPALTLDESTDELATQLRSLESEIDRLHAQRPARPVHEHWRRFKRHLDTYERLDFSRLPPDQTAARPEFGGEQWGGVMSGPALDLLLAARIAQTVVPVHFDRVAVKDGDARISFYVLGAKEE